MSRSSPLYAIILLFYGTCDVNTATISLYSPYNSASSISSYVTISGLSFGTTNPTPTSAFSSFNGGTLCSTTSWTSATTVNCYATAIDAIPGPVQLQLKTSSTASNSYYFSFDAPAVSFYTSQNAPTSDGISLTLSGINFAAKDTTATVWIGQSHCASTVWYSGTSLMCQPVSKTGGVALPIKVQMSTVFGSLAAPFSYDAPVLTTIDAQNFAASGAASLTLLGVNFGTVGATASVYIGNSACMSTGWNTYTSIKCFTTASTSVKMSAIVTVSAIVGTRISVVSFDAPVVSYMSKLNGPSTGNAITSIVGLNFAFSSPTPTAAIDEQVCATTSWSTQSTIRCITGPSFVTAGGSKATAMTVSAVVGSSRHLFSFDAPSISSSILANFGFSATASVTISGLNFGYKTSTPSMHVASEACSTTTWSSATTVNCLKDFSAAKTHQALVAVTMSLSSGTSIDRFSFDAPVVSASLPANGAATGRTSVTITGLNFALSNYSVTAMVASSMCRTSSWHSATAVKCEQSSEKRRTGYLQLTIAAVVGTSQNIFSFDSPLISTTHISSNAPNTAGASLTLLGLNFMSVDYSSTAAINRNGAAFVACTTTSWFSSSVLKCLSASAAGALTKVSLAVTVAAVVGTRVGQFSFDSPVVSTIEAAMNAVASGGGTITLAGINFGNSDYTPTAMVDEGRCSTTAWTTGTTVTCKSPAAAGTASVMLIVSTLVGTRTNVITFDAPLLSFSLTRNAPSSGGASVTISGLNFGTYARTPTVVLAGTSLAFLTTAWTSATTISAAQPTTTPSHYFQNNLAALMSSVSGTLGVYFTFDAPTISNAQKQNGPGSGSTSVTIIGMNFVTKDGTPTLAIGKSLCGTSAWLTSTSITCLNQNRGYGSKLATSITIAAVVGTARSSFTFDTPVITHSAVFNTAVSGHTLVTLIGTNFANIGLSPTAMIGQTFCATSSWSTATSLVCISSAGSGIRTSSIVTVAAVVGTRSAQFSYDAPVISNAGGSSNAPTSASASTITFVGLNFAPVDFTPTVQIDVSDPCLTTSWTTSSLVRCLPQSSAGSSSVIMTVSLAVATRKSIFSFDTPVLSHTLQGNLPMSAAASITISGLNFGTSNPTPSTTVAYSGSSCLTTSWSSGTTVQCLSPTMEITIDSLRNIAKLSVAAFVGTSAPMFTFDAPVISDALDRNDPSSATSYLTILGVNFGTSSISASARVGSSACHSTSWTSLTAIRCTTTAGAGSKLPVGLTISAVVGTSTLRISFDSPILSSIGSQNTAVSQSAALGLTLSGSNFGYTASTPTIFLASTTAQYTCSTSSWTSLTTVYCQTPQSISGASVSATVTVSALVGTRQRSFSFDSPVLTGSAGYNTPLSQGGTITMQGLNFASADLTPTAGVYGLEGGLWCVTSSWSSSTAIRCLVTAEVNPTIQIASKRTNVAITVAAAVGTRSGLFSFDSPIVSAVAPRNTATTDTSLVTISGLNFGSSYSLTPTAALGTDDACATTTWTSSTTVGCAPGASAGLGQASSVPVVLTLSGILGTAKSSFSFDAPTVSFLNRFNTGSTGGASVTISGLNFASTYNSSPTIRMGVTLCSTTSWSSATTLQCGATASTPPMSRLSSIITTASTIGTTIGIFTFDAPAASGLSSYNIPNSAGISLTLAGINFGSYDPSITIGFGPSCASTASWISATSVQIKSRTGTAGYSTSMIVTISAVVGTKVGGMTFDSPLLSSIIPFNAPTQATASLSLFGSRFAISDPTASTSFGTSACATSSWVSVSAILCRPIIGLGKQHTAVITVGVVVGTRIAQFSYDTPVLSSIPTENGPASSSNTITVNGMNFGSTDPTPTSMVADDTCGTTSWTTATNVLCAASGSAYAASAAVKLTVGALVGTKDGIFSFDAPVLSSAMFFNVATSAGTSVTISGLNFGSKSFSPSLQIGTSPCQTTSWTSGTTLSCAPAYGSGKHLAIMGSVSSTIGQYSSYFSFDAPTVSFIASSNSPYSGASSITFIGFNFAASATSATTSITGRACSTTSWNTFTSLKCKSNQLYASDQSSNPAVSVTISGMSGTAVSLFSFDSPVLSAVSTINVPPTSGLSLTLSGMNFGDFTTTPTIRIGQSVCASSMWVSTTSIVCHAGQVGSGITQAAVVTISAVVGTRSNLFSFDSPVLSDNFGGNQPMTGGGAVSILGYNFGGIDFTPTAGLRESYCSSTSWLTHTTIYCSTPAAAAAATAIKLSTILTVSTVVGTRVAVFSYDSPIVTSGHSLNLGASIGASVTISGLNFGSGYSLTPSATIDDSACITTSWTSATTIGCMAAGAFGADRGPRLTVSTLVGTGPALFTFDAPVVSYVAPQNAAASGQTSVTIWGLNFGTGAHSATATLGSRNACVTVSWATGTSLRCRSAQYAGSKKTVAVTIGQQVGTNKWAFTFDTPTISYTLPPNMAQSVGTSLTLQGQNFLTTQSSPTARIGSTNCACTAWISTTALGCYTLPGHGSRLLSVTIAAVVGTQTAGMTFDAPVLTSLHTSGNAAASGSVTLHGTNFAYEDATPTAVIGSISCGTSSWNSMTTIKCFSNGGSGSKISASVTVSATVGTRLRGFTYDTPEPTAVAPGNSATSAGATLTIRGLNFGYTNYTPTVLMSDTQCQTTTWTSSTTAFCQPSAGAGAGTLPIMTVSAVIGTAQAYLFTFDAPAVSFALTMNGGSSVGALVTISGLNFANQNYTPSMSLAASSCVTVSWASATTLQCTPSHGSGLGRSLIAHVASSSGTITTFFTFDAPVITTLHPPNGATSSGQMLTIGGVNFGTSSFSVTSSIGATACSSSIWRSTTTIVCLNGASITDKLALVVTISATVGTSRRSYSFDAPLLSQLDPLNGATSGSSTVTFTGTNFGLESATPTAALAQVQCASTSWYTVTSVLCSSPAGYSQHAPLQYSMMTVSAVVGTRAKPFSYDTPVISNVKNTNIATSAGGTVTMIGLNFGNVDTTPASYLGDTACTTTTWTSVSVVMCRSAAGYRSPSLIVGPAPIGTVVSLFTFDAPVTSHLQRDNAPMSSGMFVTISGLNFASTNASPTTNVGQTICYTTGWTSATTLQCTPAASAEQGLSPTVTVGIAIGTFSAVFTFDSPVVSFLPRQNAAASAGATFSLFGTNFMTADMTATVRLGKSACSSTSWLTSTVIKCITHSGNGQNLHAALTVSTIIGTQMGIFSYDAPIVSSEMARNGPTSSGAQITLGGVNFGVEDRSVTAMLGDALCHSSVWKSDTSILCRSGYSAGRKQNSAVTVSAVIGTRVSGFTFDAPVITNIPLSNLAAAGGASLTLLGMNFGNDDTTVSVYVGSSLMCSTSSWQSATSLTCKSPAGYGVDAAVVFVSTVVGTSADGFTYDSPASSGSALNSPISGGITLTVRGFNFANINSTPTIAVAMTMCGTASWISSTTLNCLVSSAGAGLQHNVKVSVSTIVGHQLNVFSYDSPAVTASSVNSASTGGASITLQGVNFGVQNLSVTIAMSATNCATSSWYTNTKVWCQAPLTNTLVQVQSAVTVSAAVGTSAAIFTYDSPVLSRIEPYNAALTGRTSLTMFGHNFVAADVTPTLRVGSTQCLTSSWTSVTTLQCYASYGHGKSVLTQVTISSVSNTALSALTFDAPVLTNVINVNGPSSGGFSVTLIGMSFATEDLSGTGSLGVANVCTSTSWISATSVNCLSSTFDTNTMLTISSQVGTILNIFSYSSPVVSTLLPANAPTSGGTSITVLGTNFGTTDNTPTIHFASTGCGTTSWTTSTFLQCLSRQGFAESPFVVELLASSITACAVNIFSYDAPLVTVVRTYNSPSTGRSSVTLFGLNFGSYDGSTTVAVGYTVCGTTSWTSQSTLRCLTQAGNTHSKSIVLSLATFTGTALSLFSYDAPLISSLNPTNALTYNTGNTGISLLGTNFGPTDLTTSISIASNACASSMWASESLVVCVPAPGGSGQAVVSVLSIASLIGTKLASFSFDAPVVTSLTPSNFAATSGATLSVMGLNFGNSNTTPSLNIGSSMCLSASWSSATSLACASNNNADVTSATIILTVNTVIGTSDGSFSFDAPVTSSYRPPNSPSSGLATFTIAGMNFATVDVTPTVILGNSGCVTTVWTSGTAVLCATRSGYGNNVGSTVIVGTAMTASITSIFSYDSPVISAQPSANRPQSGSGFITLSGTNFGMFDVTTSAILGLTICSTTSWTSSTSLGCAAKRGQGSALDIVVMSASTGTLQDVFTYDAPIVSSLITPNAPTAVSTALLTASGSNFGNSDTSATAVLGSTMCSQTTWRSSTQMLCESHFGSGVSLSTKVAVLSLSGTLSNTFTFDGPIITHLPNPNQPTSGSASITIHGYNFGGNNPTVTVNLASSSCHTASWTSGTALTCHGAPGYGKDIPTVVTVSTSVGTAIPLFTYDSPVLLGISSDNAPMTGGATITMRGQNMGFINVSPTITIGVSTCASSVWVSGTSLLCGQSNVGGHSSKHFVAVTIASVVRTLAGVFTYDSPVVSATLQQNAPPSSAHSVTLLGMNFGSSNLSPTIMIGSTSCLSDVWISSTSMACGGVVGLGVSYSVSVDVTSLVGTQLSAYSYDAPILSSLSLMNVPTTGGSVIEVLGVNFGTTDPTPSVVLNSKHCSSIIWSADTRIDCHAPSGSSSSNLSTISVSSIIGTSSTVFSYDSPVVTFLNPQNAPTSAGQSITTLGFNFGSTDPTASTSISGSVCSTASWSSVSSVQCASPVGTGPNKHIAISISAVLGTAGVSFSYDSPVISRLSEANSAASGGTSLTLIGTNFGSSNPSPTARLGDSMCGSASWLTHSSIICIKTAPGVGRNRGGGKQNHRAVVTLSGLLGTREDLFTYDAPFVTQLLPVNQPTTATLSITLSGMNMGYQINATPSISIGMSLCITTSWTTTTSVGCKSNYGSGVQDVKAEVGYHIGTKRSAFSYDSPVISMQLTSAFTTTGLSLTLHGANFGRANLTPSAAVGYYTRCTTVSWTSSTALNCITNVGFGASLPIIAIVNGLVGCRFGTFSFESPELTALSLINGPTSGSTRLTMSGAYFGSIDSTPSSFLGTSLCDSASWTSSTSVGCSTARGTGHTNLGAVTVGGVVGCMSAAFTYDAPIATLTRSRNSATSGGATITVLGMNFGVSDATPTGRIAPNLCATTSWNSNTVILCQTARGYGISRGVALTVSSLVGTGTEPVLSSFLSPTDLFSFDSPVTTAISTPNAPTTTTLSLSISGINFVQHDLSPLIRIGMTTCSCSSWTSQTTLLCGTNTVGAGSGVSTTISIGDSTGTGKGLFTFDAPVASHILYDTAPNKGGMSITINGVSVGASIGAMNIPPFVSIGNTQCGCTAWISATSVVVTSPAGAGSDLSIKLTLDTVVGTKLGGYTYSAPSITHLDGGNSPTSGSAQLTVHGQNFGVDDTSPTVKVSITACQTSSWTSMTTVYCKFPSGASASLPVFIDVGGQYGCMVNVLSYDAPVLTDLSRKNGPVSGAATLTILGRNFGMADISQELRVGGTLCSTSRWVSDSYIACGLASGTDIARDVSIAVQSLLGTIVAGFSYDVPVVSSLHASNGPFSGSTPITMLGMNFRSTNADIGDTKLRVSIGNTKCTSALFTSQTSLLCASAEGYGADSSLVRQNVQTGIQVASNAALVGTAIALFSYDAPVITFAMTRSGTTGTGANMPTSAGLTLTVHGTNFGGADQSANIMVDGRGYNFYSEWVSSTSATLVPLKGVGAGLAVSYEIKPLTGTLAHAFSFDSPVISSTSGVHNGPGTGATTISMTGMNFGTGGDEMLLSGGVGGGRCSLTKWLSDTSMACGVNAGAGIAQAINVIVRENFGTATVQFSYDAPFVYKLISPNAPHTGGGSLTLVGSNFGPVSFTPTVVLGETTCATAIWMSTSTVKCATPAGSDLTTAGSRNELRVTTIIDNVIGTSQSIFTYDSPVITLATANSPIADMHVLTLNGMNFGIRDSSPSASIKNDGNCITTSWISDSSILCTTPSISTLPSSLGEAAEVTVTSSMLSAERLLPITFAVDATRAPTRSPTNGQRASVFIQLNVDLEDLTTAQLYVVRDAIASHLGISSSEITMRIIAGSVIIEVTIYPGPLGANDGPALVAQLEADFNANLFTTLGGYTVIGATTNRFLLTYEPTAPTAAPTGEPSVPGATPSPATAAPISPAPVIAITAPPTTAAPSFTPTRGVPKCNGNQVLRASSGTISDGSGVYAGNSRCTWNLQSEGLVSALKLTFSEFELEDRFDWLKVYDGSSESSPLLGSFSGYSIPAPISSSSGRMFVVFTSDFLGEANGFTAEFSASATSGDPSPFTTPVPVALPPAGFIGNGANGFNGFQPSILPPGATVLPTSFGFGRVCFGGIRWQSDLSTSSGTIDDGPGKYESNSNCQWHITVNTGSRIRLTFFEFATEAGYDTVGIYDGASTTSPLLKYLSGTALPLPVESSSNQMTVHFVSDSDVEGSGFSAAYTSISTANFMSAGAVSEDDADRLDTPKSGFTRLTPVLWNGAIALVVLAVLGIALVTARKHIRKKERVVALDSDPVRPVMQGRHMLRVPQEVAHRIFCSRSTVASVVHSDQIGTDGDAQVAALGTVSSPTAVSSGMCEMPEVTSECQPWQLPSVDLDDLEIPEVGKAVITKCLEDCSEPMTESVLRDTEARSSQPRPAYLARPKVAWEERNE